MNAGLRKFALFGVIVVTGLLIATWQVLPRTSNQGYQPEQPIPFSHKLHAGTFKIECRYCHTSAYKSSHAGVPTLSTCMNCHSVVRPDSPWIQKIKKSYAELNKVLKAKYKQYIGKSYDFNGNQYHVIGFDGREFDVLIATEQGINITKMDIPIEQWTEYEIPKEKFTEQMEKILKVFINLTKGEK